MNLKRHIRVKLLGNKKQIAKNRRKEKWNRK